MTALLSYRSVVAGYRAPVVGPQSFDVNRGEIVGLSGANGSGKSTLLAVATRGARLFDGIFNRLEGLRISVQRQHHPRIAQLPFTAGDLLRMADATRQDPPPSIAPLLAERLDHLSGGQVQLLFVWAAVGSAADLVLLDEPTNNMDPRASAALAEILGRLGPDRAAVVVSHDNAFLRQVCSRIVEVGAHAH
jgi:ATPase subunit of ABC transporter with duplicated ATPase domains